MTFNGFCFFKCNFCTFFITVDQEAFGGLGLALNCLLSCVSQTVSVTIVCGQVESEVVGVSCSSPRIKG